MPSPKHFKALISSSSLTVKLCITLALGCAYSTLSEYCMWHTPLSRWNSPPIMFNLPWAAKQMLVWKLYSRLMTWRRCLVMHAEYYYVHLDPFRSIYAFHSEHNLLGWSFWVTAWTQMISVIFYIILHAALSLLPGYRYSVSRNAL